MPNRPEFSVLVTTYNEERTIDEFHRRLSDTLRKIPKTFEIVYVNDGSGDATYARLEAIFDSDPLVGCIADLFRNFGQGAALSAAVQQARGEHFVQMDSDLQLEPEELPLLLRPFDEGADVVIGYRQRRYDSFGRKIFSRLANVVMRGVARTRLRDLGCGIKVFRGPLVRSLRLGDVKVFNSMEIVSNAARHAEVVVTHHPRPHGRSGWTFNGLLQIAFGSLVDYSDRPFQHFALVMGLLGLAVVSRVALASFFAGSLMVTVTNGLLLNAILLDMFVVTAVLCVVGELVIRSLRILQRRPVFVVRSIRKRDES